MELEKFTEIINTLEKLQERQSAAYKLGIDLSNFTDDFHGIINELFKAIYSTEGYDWISWYAFEKDFGRADHVATQDGEPICFDIPSLWKELEENCK